MKNTTTIKERQHGTLTGYSYGCRCALCKQANFDREQNPAVREYHRNYWQRSEVKQKNRERMRMRKARDLQSAYLKRRRVEDVAFSIEWRLRSRINDVIRKRGLKKSDKTACLLGCTYSEFLSHLESLFVEGMTWENRHLWHVDHIKPCASFDLLDPEQQRACFNYKNLQPLWAKDNLQKGSTP